MQFNWITEGSKDKGWVRVFAPAKINLFLKVLRRLPSGYHEIQSLMIPISLSDVIELNVNPRGRGEKIVCDNPSIPTGEENLAHKALATLSEAGYNLGHVSIHIKKRIPEGAGLGGGSSDAAAVLKGIDWIYGFNLSHKELRTIGLRVGADVPFFFMERACLISGIGDVINPVEISHEMWLVIGFPGFSISTKRVYQAFDSELTNTKAKVNMPFSLGAGVRQVGGKWKLINDLETPVFVWYPFLKGFCEKLKVFGALEARMTGSGSSIFGIFKERAAASAAMSEIQRQSPEWKLFLARPVWQGIDESWRDANGSDRG